LVGSIQSLLNPGKLSPTEAFPNAETRKDILRGIFSADWVNEGEGYSYLASATAKQLLTDRDLYDIAEEIARKSPRNGSAWRELFGILSDYDQLEEALRIVEEEILSTDPTLPIMEALKIEKLQILRALKRDESARKFLAEFQSATFDLPREYQAIARNLKKR
jgi:hypothetical protein